MQAQVIISMKMYFDLLIIIGTKIVVFPNGPAKCNEFLKKVNEFLKPEIQTIVTKCNTVRMWVTHSIPKIEDGNNFGVQIQVCFGKKVLR